MWKKQMQARTNGSTRSFLLEGEAREQRIQNGSVAALPALTYLNASANFTGLYRSSA
jgi:hypothetical protein